MKKLIFILFLLPSLLFGQAQPWTLVPSTKKTTLKGITTKPTHNLIVVRDSNSVSDKGQGWFYLGNIFFPSISPSRNDGNITGLIPWLASTGELKFSPKDSLNISGSGVSNLYIPYSGTSSGHYLTGNLFSKGITSFGHVDTINTNNSANLTAYGAQGGNIKFVQALAQLGDSGSSFRAYTTPTDIQTSMSVFRSVGGNEVRKDFVISKDSTSGIEGDIIVQRGLHSFVNSKISADSRALIPRWYFDSLNTSGGGGSTYYGSGSIGITGSNKIYVKTDGVTLDTLGAGNTLQIKSTGVSAATYGSATQTPVIAVNAKGQITSASNTTITPAIGSVTGLGTGVATALGINTGSSGSFVVNGGALGTPSSGTLTNATGLPLSTGVTGVLPSANGGAGTVNGILKANGSGVVSAAVAGTDYLAPTSLSATSPITYNSGTGAIGINTATTAQAGALSSSDYVNFNNTYNNAGSKTVFYQESFTAGALAANYTTSVTTATIAQVGSTVTLTGGNAYTNLFYRNFYSVSGISSRTTRFTNTANGTGFGSGYIYRAANNQQTIIGVLDCSAGASRGTLTINRLNAGTGSVLATSTAKLTFTNTTDVVELYVYANGQVITAIARNITTGGDPVQVQYSSNFTYGSGLVLLGELQSPAIYTFGGSQTVTYDEFSTPIRKNSRLLGRGDSEMAGFYAGSLTGTYFNLLAQSIQGSVWNSSVGGASSSDALLAQPELIGMKPEFVLLNYGLNDIVQGISQATTIANYAAIIVSCELNGIIPIIINCQPVGSAFPSQSTVNTAITALNTALTTNFQSKVKIINLNAALVSGGVLNASYKAGDDIHLNDAGSYVAYRTIIAQLNEFSLSTGRMTIETAQNTSEPLLSIYNTTAGAASLAQIAIMSDVASTKISTVASNYTTTALRNKTLIFNDQSGVALYGTGTGTIDLYTSGLLKWSVLAAGTLSGSAALTTTGAISSTGGDITTSYNAALVSMGATTTSTTGAAQLQANAGTTVSAYGSYSQSNTTDGGSYAGKSALGNANNGVMLIAYGASGTIDFVTGNAVPSTNTRMRIGATGNVGIGVASPSARLHTVSTTEQERIGYDLSNYTSTTVGSSGVVTYDAVGSGSSFVFSDLITANAGIKGTATNDNATALNVGENVESAIATGSAVSLTNVTAANVTSVSLTAGDWQCAGNVNYNTNTATTTGTVSGISTTSAALPTTGKEVYDGTQMTLLTTTNGSTVASQRFSLASTTTVYLVAYAQFSAGTVGAFGYIGCRRAR